MGEMGLNKLGLDEVGLNEMGVDELVIGRTGYWTKWVLDELGLDELGMDEVGMNELALGRSGCVRSGSSPSCPYSIAPRCRGVNKNNLLDGQYLIFLPQNPGK